MFTREPVKAKVTIEIEASIHQHVIETLFPNHADSNEEWLTKYVRYLFEGKNSDILGYRVTELS